MSKRPNRKNDEPEAWQTSGDKLDSEQTDSGQQSLSEKLNLLELSSFSSNSAEANFYKSSIGTGSASTSSNQPLSILNAFAEVIQSKEYLSMSGSKLGTSHDMSVESFIAGLNSAISTATPIESGAELQIKAFASGATVHSINRHSADVDIIEQLAENRMKVAAAVLYQRVDEANTLFSQGTSVQTAAINEHARIILDYLGKVISSKDPYIQEQLIPKIIMEILAFNSSVEKAQQQLLSEAFEDFQNKANAYMKISKHEPELFAGKRGEKDQYLRRHDFLNKPGAKKENPYSCRWQIQLTKQ